MVELQKPARRAPISVRMSPAGAEALDQVALSWGNGATRADVVRMILGHALKDSHTLAQAKALWERHL